LNTSIESELPDDELAYRRRQNNESVHDRIQRKAEVAEGDDDDDDDDGVRNYMGVPNNHSRV